MSEEQKSSGSPDVNWKALALSAVVALVCGIGGAWGYSAMSGSAKSDKQNKHSDSGRKTQKGGQESQNKESGNKVGTASSKEDASAAEIPGFSSANDAETFRKELEHLSHRLDLLGARIDQITQPETQTPPVLHTLQNKVHELEAVVDQVASLPHKLDQLQQKVESVREELKMLKERASGEEMPLASNVAPAGAAIEHHADTGTGTADPADDATMKLAAGLLREGHASQAYEVLRRLQRELPNDARVWYLSALANGTATGEWGGATKRLAEQGIACERAGRPSTEKIDAALSGFSDESGTSWLAEQRRQARTR